MQDTNYWAQNVEYTEKSSAGAYLAPPKKGSKKKIKLYASPCSSCTAPTSCDSCGGGGSECS